MGYVVVVSNCHGRRSGPMGADNGVCGAVVCERGRTLSCALNLRMQRDTR